MENNNATLVVCPTVSNYPTRVTPRRSTSKKVDSKLAFKRISKSFLNGVFFSEIFKTTHEITIKIIDIYNFYKNYKN